MGDVAGDAAAAVLLGLRVVGVRGHDDAFAIGGPAGGAGLEVEVAHQVAGLAAVQAREEEVVLAVAVRDERDLIPRR